MCVRFSRWQIDIVDGWNTLVVWAIFGLNSSWLLNQHILQTALILFHYFYISYFHRIS